MTPQESLLAQVKAWEEECRNMGEVGRRKAFRQVARLVQKLFPETSDNCCEHCGFSIFKKGHCPCQNQVCDNQSGKGS